MGIKDYGIPEALVLCNDNISQKGNITYMPIYMMMLLKKDDEVNVTYKFDLSGINYLYLQPIITQYFIDNKSEIWLLFLIAHSKR